jgi:5-methylcytosine-specific restriction endonuclease McrA
MKLYRAANKDRISSTLSAYKTKHKEKILTQTKRSHQYYRDLVFSHYGKACNICGSTNNLSLDHKDGTGAQHRKELFGHKNAAGSNFYHWVVTNSYPENLQTLCTTCNGLKGSWEKLYKNEMTFQDFIIRLYERKAWILSLNSLGLSQRKIAYIIGCSRGPVQTTIEDYSKFIMYKED